MYIKLFYTSYQLKQRQNSLRPTAQMPEKFDLLTVLIIKQYGAITVTVILQ